MAQNSFSNIDINALDTIYDFSPAFNNLYTLELYTLVNPDRKFNNIKSDEEVYNVFKYHATRVTLNGESLTLKRNDITKRFQLENNAYKRTDQISVTIRENERWGVKRYHEAWLALFYDKERDCYLSKNIEQNGQYALYRILRIYFPNTTNFITMTILPSNTGDINLGWGNSSEVVSHNFTYNVEKWWWSADTLPIALPITSQNTVSSTVNINYIRD